MSNRKPTQLWSPEQIPENFAILLCAARRSGKSTLRSLLTQEPGAWLSRFEDGFITVFAGNRHAADEYRGIVPGKYVHDSLRLDVIEAYWRWVDEIRAKGKEPPKCLFIMDDVLILQSSKKHGVTRTSNELWLNRLWSEGRHQGISCILSVQSLSVGLPFIRCSDLFICFPSSFYAGQDQKMLEQCYMPIADRKMAKLICESYTQHEAMVCSYWRQVSRKWQTRIFWYKVKRNVVRRRFEECREPAQGGSNREEPAKARNPEEGAQAILRKGDSPRDFGSGDPPQACQYVQQNVYKK